ncbi:phenylacetate--CoA ligase family protein [Candidatus Sumerlaeota bacterium]|nr:phenylacetate--CoA ligase family protein [Candidatus Sumerlaeota bacterium]
MNYNSKSQRRLFYLAPPWMRDAIASVYGWRQKRRRCGERFRRHVAHLAESQWWSQEKVLALQFVKTKAFLERAGRHSVYYRNLFQERGFDPSAMQSLDDLRVLPILDKDTARARAGEIVPDDVEAFDPVWTHTSGTTGHSLRFPESAECFQREFAFRVHTIAWTGVESGERWAYCAGHPVAHPESAKPPFWIHDRANNWLLMSSYHLTESNLRLYIEKLRRFDPALIAGYPSSIYLLAIANREMGRVVRPKAILTSSETLFDRQRRAIEESFGCKAHSYYGNAERSAAIGECEKGSFHLQLLHSHVEIVDEDGKPLPNGTEGRMVCTGFGNDAFPLVRYAIGDVAAFSTNQGCACGRNGILVERLVGRAEDYVVTPDGRFVGRLDHLFKDSLHVREAQIVQDAVEEVVLRVVKEPGYEDRDERAILDEARARLGGAIRIRFEYADRIERTAHGKFRFIVSNVPDKTMYRKAV